MTEAELVKPWGCPECRSAESWVKDTSRDEDGYIVRLRRCAICGQRWATEERPIDTAAFYARAHSRQQNQLLWRHRRKKPCTYCGQPYREGSYQSHCANSSHHEAALNRLDRDRSKARRYKRTYYKRTHPASLHSLKCIGPTQRTGCVCHKITLYSGPAK